MEQKQDRAICCKVENCTYHSSGDRCNAKQIHVGPQFACCSQDTVCATFKPDKDDSIL